MGSEERLPDTALAGRSETLPPLGFYALVALLERLAPESARVGDSRTPSEERIRLRHDPALAFSASDVVRVERHSGSAAGEGDHWEVATAFLGLTGAVTPLPAYIAEEAAGDDAEALRLRAFFDLFHHRFLSLLYRGVSKYRLGYEATGRGHDPWSQRALALSGLDSEAAARLGVPLDLLLRFTPLLADGARPARSLELALEEALERVLGRPGPKARVEQFVGAWVNLVADDRFALGQRNQVLGRHAPLGGRCFVRSGVVRIHLAPLDAEVHARLVNGDLRKLVDSIVQLFARDPIDYELNLQLERGLRPVVCLGAATCGRLGVDAWLASAASLSS